MAQSGDFLARIKLALEGKDQVVAGLQETQQAAQQLSKTKVTTTFDKEGLATGKQIEETFTKIGDTAKKSTPLMDQFGMALKRALIVAPIWMVAREVIKETITFVKDGISYYLDMEKAILNVRSSIMEMGTAGESTIAELTSRFHSLSLETGKAEASIGNIYATVNRILGNTEQSFLATNAAVKLSEATGVDAAKIAESVAFMYKLQGDSLKGVTTDTQKFQEISELLYTTQAKTPGGLEKLITDIRGFAGTMNVADFGIENTIKLFGALESSGITSGQVLRTGVMKVLTNIDEVSKMLGIDISKTLTPFQAFIMVLEKLGTTMKPGQLNANTFAVIKDIFGTGARGAGQVVALAKDLDSLKSALSGTGVSERDRYLYKKQIEDVTNSAEHQIEIFGNLKKQAGESFITAIMGGKDFAEAMKNVNNIMNEGIRVTYNLGAGLNLIGKGIGFWTSLGTAPFVEVYNTATKQLMTESDLQQRIFMGLKGQLTLVEQNNLIGEVAVSNLITEEGTRKRILDLLKKQGIEEVKKGVEISKNNEKMEQANILAKKQADELENLIFKYEKATKPERKTIGREIELAQMAPESQVAAFQNLTSDRKLLLEMLPRLSEEVRNAIAGIIAREQGLNVGGRFGTVGVEGLNAPGWTYGGPLLAGAQAATYGAKNGMININSKAADTININLAYEAAKSYEETVRKINEEIMDKLLTNENFRKFIDGRIEKY